MSARNRAARNRKLRDRLRRSTERPASFTDRIESITTPLDRPATKPEFGSGVLPPGTSRYQRLSAHLPSGVTPFEGIGVIPADVAIDLTGDDPSLDLTG